MAKRRKSSSDAIHPAGSARKPDGTAQTEAATNENQATRAAEHASNRLVEEQRAFPIVGVGASAGGLEAFSELLQALPSQIGFAIVLVQHLAPLRKSGLPELLAAKTKIPVVELAAEMPIEAGRVYVIPPNVQLEIMEDHFRVSPRPADQVHQMPIDVFFHSLAVRAGDRAVGVVMSGTATDGAMGLRDIKAYGGITIAQTPGTAKYDSMPRAAIEADAVDLVLAPAQIAEELVQISQNRYFPPRMPQTPDGMPIEEHHLARVFALLRGATGVDFSLYKSPTIRRRLQRRMALQKVNDIEDYLAVLQENPSEVQDLYRDILIHVTRFFREPESFDTLNALVYPKITQDRRRENPIRVWVPGCSTGEESYSVAISLLEYLGDQAASVPIQIFATDVSETAIERARTGIYPEDISVDVSAQRLRRFFTGSDGNYQVSKTVRGLCVFARQDLTHDPPFSRLDLIVCRNVLIYLTPQMQRKLMTLFHYALNPGGFLVLGSAETVGPHSELFSVADKKHRVYSKKTLEQAADFHFPIDYRPHRSDLGRKAHEGGAIGSIQEEASRLILERYSPPGVVVGPNLQIIQFRGQTGKFLEPAPGDASFSVLKMAREGILYALRTALRDAQRSGKPVRRDGLQVKTNGDVQQIELEVVPFGSSGDDRYYLILFREAPANAGAEPVARDAAKSKKRPTRRSESQERIAVLQQELAASREHLQAIIQDLEAANEELQSANEEVLSSNEELQSTNEELDTAKEELQSTNEELNTVNSELHNRNEELRRINSDLVNLLANVQIAIVMVDSALHIRRFTPIAEEVLNLIPSDVGRPIGHIKPNIDCPDLEPLIVQAIQNVQTIDREVQDTQGAWYSLRVRPYQGPDNRIDGAVLALIDIDAAKRNQGDLERARDYAEAVVEAVDQPLLLLDENLRILRANNAFCGMLATPIEDIRERYIYEIGDGQWDQSELRSRLQEVLPRGRPIDGLELAFNLPRGTQRLRLSARPISDKQGNWHRIFVAVQNVSQASK